MVYPFLSEIIPMPKTSWIKRLALLLSFSVPTANAVKAEPVTLGQKAPDFELKTEEGKNFRLSSRQGTWTVLYFYPKADTPGCTKQACAYRDAIKKIRDENAEVYGISTDTVAAIEAFHKKHHLSFTLLADDTGAVTESYGVKMPLVNLAKRWTFIVDPQGVIRDINTDVDPASDADNVASRIRTLKQ
jgi:peroxiredoxin Q/BCP